MEKKFEIVFNKYVDNGFFGPVKHNTEFYSKLKQDQYRWFNTFKKLITDTESEDDIDVVLLCLKPDKFINREYFYIITDQKITWKNITYKGLCEIVREYFSSR